MKTLLKSILLFAVPGALTLASLAAEPDDKSAGTFKDDKEKASYGIGVYFANQIKRNGLEVDVDTVISAMQDILAGKPAKLTDQQASEAIRNYLRDQQAKAAEKNKKEGETFLAENKNKPGVKTKTVTLPGGQTAEMQYKIIKEGTGETPKSNDMVRVNYRGTLVNGKEFDSTAKHGTEPSKLAVNGVIKGWSDALEMMKVGSKWEIYLPATLAYGDRPAGPDIGPGSTLIFEMELVGIEPPAPPPAPAQPSAPLTSDIIRVPSAEELKKGDKIQVLKPEDVERLKKEQEEKEKKDKEKKP